MSKVYPYTTTEPHVHDFSGLNSSAQSICVYCGAPVFLGSSGGTRTGKTRSYTLVGPRLPGEYRRTKW